ncbi:MAG: flagellar hook-length control protein FliK [bacterium]|nr:flagellar hook-length control protein FliK [bacterium]
MENSMLVSLMASTQATQESSKAARKPEAKDGDSFSKAMQEAGGKNGFEELLAEQDDSQQRITQRRDDSDNAQRKPTYAKLNRPAPGSREYIHDQMYKNPDTMTMAEKRALNLPLDNGSKTVSASDMAEMRALAAERGINLRDLAMTQMPKDTQVNKNNTEANAKEFAKALGEEEGKGKEGKTKDAGNAAASENEKSEGKIVDKSLAEAVLRHTEEGKAAQQNPTIKKRQQVINQIVEHMELRNLANRDELHLKLNPEYLGELKIKLTRGENGEVSAQFITTSDETKEVLQDSRSELRTRVEATGLKLGTISIAKVDDLETGLV